MNQHDQDALIPDQTIDEGQISDPTPDEGDISNAPLDEDRVSNATPDEHDDNDESVSSDEETFDRAYVEDLRKESAGYRTQLRTVQEQLHRLQVEQTGKLADPADLAFDPTHLDDPEALTAAIDALLEAKPHLKRRALPAGAAAQGPKNTVTGDVNLVDLMRVGF